MKKIIGLGIAMSFVGGVFVAGVAVGKVTKAPKFIAKEELKWADLQGGLKFGVFTGDMKKGPVAGLLQLPAGFTSPFHSHSGDYEAVQIMGTSSHWLKNEDGTKAKKMVPGSYWSMPGKLDHVSACDKGTDCVMFIWQKTKFDFVPGKEDKAVPAKADPKTAPTKAPAPAPAPAKM
ncbi:MAG TPA: DUF4437 domain-containing protein [Kofleriaceae bacterium]